MSVGGVLQQAQLDAAVKYGPARSALAQLLMEARGNLHEGTRNARQASNWIASQAAQSLPAVQRSYHEAGSQDKESAAEVAANLAPLSAAADPFRAAITREQGAETGRLAQSLAEAQQGIHQDTVQAGQARQYETGQLEHNYEQTAAQVAQKAIELAGEQGTFTAADAGTLRTAAQKAAREEAKQAAGEREGKESLAERYFKDSQKAPAKPTHGPGSLTQSEERGLDEKLNEAVTWTRKLLGTGQSPEAVKELLATGAKAGELSKEEKPTKANPKGKVGNPEIPAFNEPVLVQSAMHIARYGHVSPEDEQGLHKLGIHVPGKYRPPRVSAQQTPAVSPKTANPFFGPGPGI